MWWFGVAGGIASVLDWGRGRWARLNKQMGEAGGLGMAHYLRALTLCKSSSSSRGCAIVMVPETLLQQRNIGKGGCS